ncbi:28S ribosomal protein S9, mitochondrial isoform X2 [Protopterus annectens]|uniref:28S ribosomal protein S9, mitochondrial isoform X2 n=1 Tax=Protopterus annectens TaxID=7888 RepID=UPI001CFA847C|nr:28S ribosomal protein S9, mitochondrial isoform X2 [Protopterus annectens]
MAASNSRVLRSVLNGCYGSVSWLSLCGRHCTESAQRTCMGKGWYLSQSLCSRSICSSSHLQKRNVAATGPEKFSDEFVRKQIEKFNIGKRHLANMMGEDPETFTQEDIDKAIAYLFPSGLFDKKARPLMKHPEEIFPKQQAIQWAPDGRPFHFLFYTGKQTYYSLQYDTYEKLLEIQKYEDRMRAKDLFSKETKQVNLSGSRWLTKEELEEMLVEKMSDQDYMRFIHLLERILTLPYASTEEEHIQKFRKTLEVQSRKQKIEPIQYDDKGRGFSIGEGRRKSATASVKLYENGTGKITINGDNHLQFFPVLQDREQLMFPFQFLDRLCMHDMDCTVSGGGSSAQAGAIRLAASRALLSFIPENAMESMRQAGLLTPDPRVKERKKPGQEGARRKFTWKKR